MSHSHPAPPPADTFTVVRRFVGDRTPAQAAAALVRACG